MSVSYGNFEIHKSAIFFLFVSQRLYIKFLKQIATNTHKTGFEDRKSDVDITLRRQVLAITNTER